MSQHLPGYKSEFRKNVYAEVGPRPGETDGDHVAAMPRARSRDQGREVRGPPPGTETGWGEPFVRPDASLRSALLHRTEDGSLEQLTRLTLEKGESQTPFVWLLNVRGTLTELRACLSGRAEPGRGAESLRRPDIAARIDQFVEDRWRHRFALDGLLADVDQAISSRSPDTTTLSARLRRWLDRQRRIQSLGPELMFRLYWDDLGGEG